MITMDRMAKKKPRPDVFDREISVRIFDKAKTALEGLLVSLKRDPRLQFQERALTQDALLAASWLWMEELGPEKLAAQLAKHMPTIEGLARSNRAARALEAEGEEPEGAATLRVMNHAEDPLQPRPRKSSKVDLPTDDERTAENDVPRGRR